MVITAAVRLIHRGEDKSTFYPHKLKMNPCALFPPVNGSIEEQNLM